jgi:hypothetical protein
MRRSALFLAVAVLVVATGASARPAGSVLLRVQTDGVVVGSPGNFRCAGRCAIPFERGTLATLHALRRAHFAFSHWAGDCVGTSRTCVLALDRAQSVRVVYEGHEQSVELTVGGPGIVRSEPEGLVCGRGHDSACSATFPFGTRLRLIADTGRGAFARWGAACWNAGRGACRLTIRHDTQVIAAFGHRGSVAEPQVLTVETLGPRVRSKPNGIDCPGVCKASFPAGTPVLLRSEGVWGGDCVGDVTSRCPLLLDAATRVVVGRPVPHSQGGKVIEGYGLNVTVSGKGIVTAPGIKCGGVSGSLFDCESFFDLKETVVLRAKPSKHARFAGWSQFCTGKKPTCTLHVAASMTVGAAFRR